MPIHFRCPHCDKLLAIGTAKGGTQIHCPLCDRPITVPPRTEVKLPTTTVMPPELAQSWWMDAPPAVTPNPKPSPLLPTPAPGEAWWLTANAPPAPVETAVTNTPAPAVPPPLPQPLVSVPAGVPSADLLVFKPEGASFAHPDRGKGLAARSFTTWHLVVIVVAGVLALLVLSMVLLLLHGSESTPAPSTKPAERTTQDDTPASPEGEKADWKRWVNLRRCEFRLVRFTSMERKRSACESG